MKITNKILTSEEENIINYCLENFRKEFDVELKFKEEYIGIGEENKHLMCYFSLKDDKMFVKFKNFEKFEAILNPNLDYCINATINLFKNNNFSLKVKDKQSVKKSKVPADILNHLTKVLDKFEGDDENMVIENCSARLENILLKNKILTIKDLKNAREKLFDFSGFGMVCFWELYKYILFAQKDDTNKEKYRSFLKFLDEDVLSKNKVIEFYPKDAEESLMIIKSNFTQYETLKEEIINFIKKYAKTKLTSKEVVILFERIGINDTPKTLQEIGNKLKVTRERIRQVLVKIEHKFNSRSFSNFENLEFQYIKFLINQKLTEEIKNGFATYIYAKTENIEFVKFVYKCIFNCEIDSDVLKRVHYLIEKEDRKNHLTLVETNRMNNFNKKVYDLICFDYAKPILEEDFEKLKFIKPVDEIDANLVLEHENKNYYTESLYQKNTLLKFLKYGTFKQIKTLSLELKHKSTTYYPDFQALTHDNRLVIIDVKPIFNMSAYNNIEKFNTLKEYCKENGLAYLIVDDRMSSFEKINDVNEKFNKLILEYLENNNNTIPYNEYKKIYVKTKANTSQLLTLIKNHHLKLSFPFNLTKLN